MIPSPIRPGLMLLLFAASILVPACRATSGPAPAAATITYQRVFKGSVPEFIEIKITEPGAATFEIRQLEEDPGADMFEVGPAVRAKIFELAGKLNNFEIADLEVQKKIANLGQKTFRYERDAEKHETTFNYTLNPAANQLMQIFEGLAKQQNDMVTLERRVKFDHLGVNDALRQFESDLDHQLLPEPERLLPVLDQIAGDSRFVDIARTRARSLAERIRNSHGQ
jgi:hypothetical protein